MPFKLCFYVPTANAQACKQAIFATKAGTYPGALYDQASFESIGTGQFRPLQGSNPTLGRANQLERVEELRIEIFCGDQSITKSAVEALIKAHPYEQPAYEVFKMEDF